MKKIVENPGLIGSKSTVHLTDRDIPYRDNHGSPWSPALCGVQVRIPLTVKLSSVTCTQCIRKASGK